MEIDVLLDTRADLRASTRPLAAMSSRCDRCSVSRSDTTFGVTEMIAKSNGARVGLDDVRSDAA